MFSASSSPLLYDGEEGRVGGKVLRRQVPHRQNRRQVVGLGTLVVGNPDTDLFLTPWSRALSGVA